MGLAPGNYTLQVTWNASPNHASDAPYQVYDGTTLVQTVLVDQRAAPAGPSFGGVTFQTLTTVTVSSGTLRVVLADDADGDVVADALHLFQV
jgi:hypothetical protein